MRLDNATLEKLIEDAINESYALMDADKRQTIIDGITVGYNARMDQADRLCGSAQGKLKKFAVGEDKIEATVSDFNDYDIVALTKMKGRMVTIQGDQAELFETRGEAEKKEKTDAPKDDRQPDLFDNNALEAPSDSNMVLGAVITALETVKDENKLILVDKGGKYKIAAVNRETGAVVLEDGPVLEKERWGSFALYLSDNPILKSASQDTDENDDSSEPTGDQDANEAPDTQTPTDAGSEAPTGKKRGRKKKDAPVTEEDAPQDTESARPFFATVSEGDTIICKEAFDSYRVGRAFSVVEKNIKNRVLVLQEVLDLDNNPHDDYQGDGQPFEASIDLVNELFTR